MLRVVVADSHPITRLGLRTLCDDRSDLSVVADCALEDCVRTCRQIPWDVLLLSLGYPTLQGFDTLSVVRAFKPLARVLIFTLYPEELFARRAMSEGATGYLTKQADPSLVVSVVRQVARGERYIPPEFAQRHLLLETGRSGSLPLHEDLSSREFQILQLVVRGRCPAEIAVELSLSVKTVHTFRSRIFRKLRVRNDAELVVYAMQNGLLAVNPDMVEYKESV